MNSVIENLVSLLHDMCAEIHRLSGWSTLAMSGGPNPTGGGIISMQMCVCLAEFNFQDTGVTNM